MIIRQARVLFILVTVLLAASQAWAKVYIDLSAPNVKKLSVAVQEFRDTSSRKLASSEAIKKDLHDALSNDIRFSGVFTQVDKAAFIEPASWKEGAINFQNWRSTGADALVRGSYTLEGDRLTLEVWFYDCVSEKEVLAKRYTGAANNPRRLIHYLSDQLYQEFTGRKGIFTTKLLFVSDKTGKKEIYISDYDGMNARQITYNRSINLSPQWSPDGKKILYTSYKKVQPYLYTLDLRTGKDAVVSEKPGLNLGGRFSPDGSRVALTLTVDKSSEIYTLDLNTRQYVRVTHNSGIDVSPSWSPDGGKLAFTSDMSGNPNIFVVDLASGTLKRLTFSGKYNASPVWSPDGRQIAFARSENGVQFHIWVVGADGGSARQLTFEGNNKNPSWSPDGRFILFSSTVKGNSSLYITQSDGTGLARLSTGIGNEKSPAWSPFIQ